MLMLMIHFFAFAQTDKKEVGFDGLLIDTAYHVFNIYNKDTTVRWGACVGKYINNTKVLNGPCWYYDNTILDKIIMCENGEEKFKTLFYPNKTVEVISVNINDTTIIEYSFYQNGNIHQKQCYFVKETNICPTGTWYDFYENGLLENKGDYIVYKLKDGETIFNTKFKNIGCSGNCEYLGLKNGIWQYYDDKGNLIKEEKYVENKIVETKKYQ
jgi:antitoxin component YwqK of YwqJK toxin-antitoxin module